jgi:seryl-tRNA synthetase (EC 6.1.1.11)
MLDLKFIRENLEVVKNKLSQRNLEIDLDHVIEIDQKRREIIQEVETLRNERNTVSEIIAAAKKEKKMLPPRYPG